MPRQPNPFRSVQVTVSINTQILHLLDELVASGMFGMNRADAIERLMSRHMLTEVERVRTVPVKETKA